MNIKVIALGETVNTFSMNTNAKVMDLKIKIKDYLAVDFGEQTLLYENKLMDNDNVKLIEFGLIDGCIVKLIINFKKEKFTFSIQMQGRDNFNIEVNSEDSLIEVKKKSQNICKLCPEEQIWVFLGKELEGDDPISSYGICEDSMVTIIQRLINKMQIFAKTMDSKTVTLEIMQSDTILNTKKNIQENIGLTPEEQRLVYNGGILEDNKTVEEYNIVEKSTIYVVAKLRYAIQIFVKTMDGKTVSLSVLKSNTILNIKKKIQEKIGLIPEEQKTIYQGAILEDYKTVEEYNIDEKSTIYVVARLRCYGIRIFAKTMDGKAVSFEVTKSDTILNIKKIIQEKIGLIPDEPKLVYQGVVLENNKTVEEYNIVENSVINVVARLSGGIQIYAKTMDGKTVSLEIMKDDTILNIKKKIQEKMGLTPEEQKLVYQAVILEDDKTAEECQIAENSIINVMARLKNGMQIFAKTMDGKTVALEIMKSDTILNVKKKIQENIGLTPEEQRLVYQVEILEDNKTVEEYNIVEESVINVVDRLTERVDSKLR